MIRDRDPGFADILAGAVYALGGRAGAMLVGGGTAILIARVYGARSMGDLAVVDSLQMLLATLAAAGPATATLRLIPEHLARHSARSAYEVFRTSVVLVVGLSALLGLAVVLGADALAERVFDEPELASLFRLAGLALAARALSDLTTQSTRGLKMARAFAVMQVMPALATLALLLAAMALSSSPRDPAHALLGGYVGAAIVGLIVTTRGFAVRMRPADRVSPMRMRELLEISSPMLLAASIVLFLGQIGVILLGVFRSQAEVGVFSVATRMAAITAFPLMAFGASLAPRFSELYHTGRLDELFSVARRATRVIFWTSAPVLALLVVSGPTILDVAFGASFVAAYPALVVLMLGQLVHAASGCTSLFLDMTGDQAVLRNLLLAAAVLCVGLGLLLVPAYGMLGAAIASAAALVTWNVGALRHIRRRHGRSIGYLPGLGR